MNMAKLELHWSMSMSVINCRCCCHVYVSCYTAFQYQSMWGVLRFESAMGPKRLELFEPGSKEKCFVINANIYPLTTVPFTQTLGLHPDHTLRPGIFPFKVCLAFGNNYSNLFCDKNVTL